MNVIQKFCLENIYCAPSQDRQYFFKLIRANKENAFFKRKALIYNLEKHLPNKDDFFYVYTIGNLYPEFVNFLQQIKAWYRDEWLNIAEEMINRNMIVKIYSSEGIVYPSTYFYYSFINENALLIAVKIDREFKNKFDINKISYIHFYSNSYFNSDEYINLPNRIGIDVLFSKPSSNIDKVNLQNYISNMEQNGGRCLIYVDGFYTEKLLLTIPNYSFIEIIYDQSIVDLKEKRIDAMRTFDSEIDNRMKYLMFNNVNANFIRYFDDNDFYILTSSEFNNKGLYFYRHKNFVIRNVTDKDYSLDTTYLNNQATILSNLTSGYLGDKKVVAIVRKPGLIRELKFSSLKLHEFYKLPPNKQEDCLVGSNFGISKFRAEHLENSEYFKLASSRIQDLTKERCLNVLGYNATTFYFGKNIFKFDSSNIVSVPPIYREPSTAFEYDINGKYIGTYTTSGPIYIKNNVNAKYVEFLYGVTPSNFGKLYNNNETFTPLSNEYRILSALFVGLNQVTKWEDITDNKNKVIRNNNSITLNESDGKKIKVVYFNQLLVYDIELNLNDGFLYFPLTQIEDRGTGLVNNLLNFPYLNIEIFMNGYKLIYGLDFFINFPYISICNKKYINYTNLNQNVHIRCYGFNLDENKINSTELRGFVNHGVVLRNKFYDIKDDKVFCTFIDGKIYENENLIYAEEDNTIRLSHSLNGLPYTLKEPFIPFKHISDIDTLPYFTSSQELNTKISNLFNLIYPETNVNEMNVISDHHYLFSPTVSRIINHVISGVIPFEKYSNFNDMTIINMLNNEYKNIYDIDPIKHIEENNIVEIHPHLGNTVIALNIYQYRFIERLVQLISNNRINLSGYLAIS